MVIRPLAQEKPHVEIIRKLGACPREVLRFRRFKTPESAWRNANSDKRSWIAYRLAFVLGLKGYKEESRLLRRKALKHDAEKRSLRLPDWVAILKWIRANDVDMRWSSL